MLAKLQAYKFMGVNRLSMGVQSMDNDRLRYLGRIHTAENVARDMDIIRRKGFDNVNLDLMFSVPGESGDDALSDLEKILEFRPEHISCYSLQIEEGTPFGKMAESGELTEVPDTSIMRSATLRKRAKIPMLRVLTGPGITAFTGTWMSTLVWASAQADSSMA